MAQQAGVGVETVRFCERQGLFDEPPRPPSGYREYPEQAKGAKRCGAKRCHPYIGEKPVSCPVLSVPDRLFVGGTY
ncbi:MAG: MerR family DNA-binding transcriptional regulator [Planctomycetota bacterium]|nr:MerR family DNA-binding transcriptional regulator [Planctomycetota bacterium]